MKKKGKSSSKKSVFVLLIAVVFAVFALVFTFHSFSYGKDDIKEYKSFVDAIEKGIDINGGFYAVLEPVVPTSASEKEKLNDNVSEAVKVMGERLSFIGFHGAAAIEQTESNGDKSIRIEIPKKESVQTVSDAEDVFRVIMLPALIEFKIQNESDVILTNSDIAGASAITSQGNDFTQIKFTRAGRKALNEKATKGKTLEIYLDGQNILSQEIESEFGDSLVFNMNTRELALDFAAQIDSGNLPVEFQSLFEAKTLSPVLGQNVLKSILISCIIGVCLIILLIFVLFKGFGISFTLSLLIYIALLLFMLSQLPVQLTLLSLIGIILSIGIAAGFNIIIFEKIKNEYSSGKSLVNSFNGGFRRSRTAIFDISIVVFILAIVLLIFGGPARSFGIILVFGVILSVIISFTLNRLFIKSLLPLNNKNKFYGLKRGIIEDEEE